jgi:hypothetical protein
MFNFEIENTWHMGTNSTIANCEEQIRYQPKGMPSLRTPTKSFASPLSSFVRWDQSDRPSRLISAGRLITPGRPSDRTEKSPRNEEKREYALFFEPSLDGLPAADAKAVSRFRALSLWHTYGRVLGIWKGWRTVSVQKTATGDWLWSASERPQLKFFYFQLIQVNFSWSSFSIEWKFGSFLKQIWKKLLNFENTKHLLPHPVFFLFLFALIAELTSFSAFLEPGRQIVSIDAGIQINWSDEHLSNGDSPRLESLLPNSIANSDNWVHDLKQNREMVSIDEEIQIDWRDEHLSNADSRRCESREPGSNVTSERVVQYVKQDVEIVSMDEGIQIDWNDEQKKNR